MGIEIRQAKKQDLNKMLNVIESKDLGDILYWSCQEKK